jgi:hypothetical protein
VAQTTDALVNGSTYSYGGGYGSSIVFLSLTGPEGRLDLGQSHSVTLAPGAYELYGKALAIPSSAGSGSGRFEFNLTALAVPEPSSALTMGIGLMGVIGLARVRRTKA